MTAIQYAIVFLLVIVLAPLCLAQTQDVTKIDDVANTQCDDFLGRTLVYATKLKADPASEALIMIYDGKTVKGLYDGIPSSFETGRHIYPSINLHRKLISTISERLQLLGIPKSRIVFINGGRREKLSVELWMVRAGSQRPPKQPNIRRMRYRSVAARGYCTSI